MDQDKNTSFSLLSQLEIDTLVAFLTEKKNSINSDVLNQESIDKLIMLLHTDKERMALSNLLLSSSAGMELLSATNFRSDIHEVCELLFQVNNDTGFVELKIFNTVSKETIELTPRLFSKGDSEHWGAAIQPSFFNRIAHVLTLKYTQETHDNVCRRFAKIMYGDENFKLPLIYLPGNEALIESLL